MATVLQHFNAFPAAGSPQEFSLPLVFFDIMSYSTPQISSILFYEFPEITKSHFTDTIVPHLKASLSLTLTHFLPFAGNIIHPLNAEDKPILRYEVGDSLSFTVSESSADFNHLTGNHPRACGDFYALAPCLPLATCSGNSIACPVLTLQVTLFPGQGLSIGYTYSHAITDGTTLLCFFKAWSLINRNLSSGIEFTHNLLTEANLLPFFNRDTLTNHNELFSIYWNKIVESSATPEPKTADISIDNKVRATFVLKKDEIQKLKDFVSFECSRVVHLSSFSIICALVWVCFSKSAAEEVAEDQFEYFYFSKGCRERLDPPLPTNYFGNCIGVAKVELKHGEVKGNDGFVAATKAIGEVVQESVYNDEGILYDANKWLEMLHTMEAPFFWVSGYPKFNFYGADFGWGKAKKYEDLVVDWYGVISLCKSRDFEGGVEIGVSKTMVEMDSFTRVFNEVLSDLLK